MAPRFLADAIDDVSGINELIIVPTQMITPKQTVNFPCYLYNNGTMNSAPFENTVTGLSSLRYNKPFHAASGRTNRADDPCWFGMISRLTSIRSLSSRTLKMIQTRLGRLFATP